MLQVSGTLSMVGGTMANATPRHGPTQVHSTASSCTSEKLTGVQDQHSTDRARQSTEDGQVRKTIAGEYRECRGDVFPILAPNRPLLYANQCLGLHREVPRGSHVVPMTSMSRQQSKVKREMKILEEW